MKINKEIIVLGGLLLLLLPACQKWDLEQKEFLKVKLNEVEYTGTNSVMFSANLEGLNESVASNHGFIWSDLDSLPELIETEELVLELGAKEKNGSFSGSVSNIIPNTKYWIRGFATINGTTIYSPSQTFFIGIDIQLEMLRYKAIRGTTTAQAQSSMKGLKADEKVDTYGHCWSANNKKPTLLDNSTSFGETKDNVDAYSSILTNLVPYNTYYVRPYAQSGSAIFYGPVDSLYKKHVWEEKEIGPDVASDGRGHFSLHGKAYLIKTIGGGDQMFLWQYDPLFDRWAEKAMFPGELREYYFYAATSDKAYLGLGIKDGEFHFNDLWEYDPLDTSNGMDVYGDPMGKWTPKQDFPMEGRLVPFCFSMNEKVYMAFGERSNSTDFFVYADIWEYDPKAGANGVWTQLFTDCECGKRSSGTAFVIGDKAYICGGGADTDVGRQELWELNLNASSNPCVLKLVDPEIERYLPTGIGAGDKAYYGSGIHGSAEIKKDFWEYDALSEVNGFDSNGNPKGEWIYLGELGDGAPRNRPLSWKLNDRLFFGFGSFVSAQSFWEYLPDD